MWTTRAIFQNKAVPICKNFFRTTFVQYVTVWFVWIWTYKNADEKEHTCSRRSENVKKQTKTDEKRILCQFTFTKHWLHPVWGQQTQYNIGTNCLPNNVFKSSLPIHFHNTAPTLKNILRIISYINGSKNEKRLEFSPFFGNLKNFLG